MFFIKSAFKKCLYTAKQNELKNRKPLNLKNVPIPLFPYFYCSYSVETLYK